MDGWDSFLEKLRKQSEVAKYETDPGEEGSQTTAEILSLQSVN